MGITTITPSHGRVQLVENLLASLELARQTYQAESESVVIDSSESNDAEAIRSLCQVYHARYIRGPVNVRIKRTIGIQNAMHELILCIDSDCEAEPTLLSEHQRTYDNSPEIVGVLGVTRFRGRQTWIWSILKHTSLLTSFSFAEQFPYIAWGTCSNLSLKKDVVTRVGGFRIDWPFRLGGDDLDLTLRITEQGGLIKSNPDAVVWHTTETWNKASTVIERAWRWGRMEYYILNQHQKLERFSSPRPVVIFAFLILLALTQVFSKGLLVLCLPLAWLVLFLVLFTMIRGFSSRQSPGVPQLLAQVIQLVYESGSITEFVLHGDWRFLYKRLEFSDEQIFNEWNQISHQWDQQVFQVWAVVIASLLVVVGVYALQFVR